jgi:hypothetical protein
LCAHIEFLPASICQLDPLCRGSGARDGRHCTGPSGDRE